MMSAEEFENDASQAGFINNMIFNLLMMFQNIKISATTP